VVTYEFGKVLCAIEIASSVHRTTAEQHTIDNTDINSIKHRSYLSSFCVLFVAAPMPFALPASAMLC
jgi:hypothetical protein